MYILWTQGTTLFNNNRTHVTHLCSMKNDQFIKISGYSSLSKQFFLIDLFFYSFNSEHTSSIEPNQFWSRIEFVKTKYFSRSIKFIISNWTKISCENELDKNVGFEFKVFGQSNPRENSAAAKLDPFFGSEPDLSRIPLVALRKHFLLVNRTYLKIRNKVKL